MTHRLQQFGWMVFPFALQHLDSDAQSIADSIIPGVTCMPYASCAKPVLRVLRHRHLFLCELASPIPPPELPQRDS
jgi:hypothetical protein